MSKRRLQALFVCSRNQWRSPTAENVYRDDPRLSVRSRGLSPQARRQISDDDVDWADVIFVMESKHRGRLNSRFRDQLAATHVCVLDNPDEYPFMDPELVELIKDRVEWHLAALTGE